MVGGLPPAGLLGFAGAAAAAAGVPPHLAPPSHPGVAAAAAAQAQALLKPTDLQHRAAAETPEDRKPIPIPDERLRRSVSPGEKFRTRTPDIESDPKRRKEEKLGHVSPFFLFITFYLFTEEFIISSLYISSDDIDTFLSDRVIFANFFFETYLNKQTKKKKKRTEFGMIL